MKYIDAFFMALSMFCAVPCPYRPWRKESRKLMLFFFPFVGAVIGAIWALSVAMCRYFNVPSPVLGAVIAAMPYLLTGFFDLDGFMDTNDALLSRRDLDERLRILKDSRVGAFAVIAVGLLLMFAYASGYTIAQKDTNPLILFFIPIASRFFAAIAVFNMKPLEHSQYSSESEAPSHWSITVFLVQAVVVVPLIWLLTGPDGIIVAAAAGGFYVVALLHAVKDLGGISGDLSGYALTLGELGALIVCALL